MSVKNGIIRFVYYFITWGYLPTLGNDVARHYGIYLLLFDKEMIMIIGFVVAVLAAIEKTFEVTQPAVSGVSGILRNIVALWYFFKFLEMITFIQLPALHINISVSYNLIKDLIVTSILLTIFKHVIQVSFSKYLAKKPEQ
ncbi:MAG: hypothetical protein ACTSXW_02785 [Candidatus Baldrarchaeia archaeon]